MTPALTATYRLQLRNGVDFAAAAAQLPLLAELGFSHLYLSPPYTAAEGSTHGYDVTDPTAMDPALGGMEGFEGLAQAARAHGIGLILDAVPNHTAFSAQNPWLFDVLRHGQGSRYAPHFDIDWQAGPLVLPVLGDTFDAMLEAGEITVEGDAMVAHGTRYPLRPDIPVTGTDAEAIRALHAVQHWRLAHWLAERDHVTHRRFFNVTGLIGMRVEDPKVFEEMHATIFDLVNRGLVQGLRLDHIDGLADPAGYLQRLRARLPETPIWVEKILVGPEDLPDWPVEGTTGYEAARLIAMLLTDGAGRDRLMTEWKDATGAEGTFHDALAEAKAEVMRNELSVELHQLIGLAGALFPEGPEAPGAETLREAVLALLRAFPRYRSYVTAEGPGPEDARLIREVTETAAEGVRIRTTLDSLRDSMLSPDSPEKRAFTRRFQQVTGALLAKAHEDTAGFRWNGFLAVNEVGAEPDWPILSPADLQGWAEHRKPHALTLTSSHDTKRSEDARMRLVALSRHSEDFLSLWHDAEDLPHEGVGANRRWYLLQSALAIWDPEDHDLEDRLRAHTVKAMREAKQQTNWISPDEAAEAAAADWVTALVARWRSDPPAALGAICATGASLSLVQLALKMLLPGVPDIYQGCIGINLALTDPDNRRPVDLAAQAALHAGSGISGDKARLTRHLLALRRDDPGFFDRAGTTVTGTDESLVLTRTDGRRRLVARLFPGAPDPVALEDDA